MNLRPGDGTLYVRNLEGISDKHEAYLEMRPEIEVVSSTMRSSRHTTGGRTSNGLPVARIAFVVCPTIASNLLASPTRSSPPLELQRILRTSESNGLSTRAVLHA